MRPFRIGDYITTCGESGTVEDIQMFYTTLVTPDNKVIKVPNGSLIGSTIVNISVKESRRVDVVMSIAYDANYELAKSIILDVSEFDFLSISNLSLLDDTKAISIPENRAENINDMAIAQ